MDAQSCAHTYIGDEKNRRISGGQRRRVSIGVDIIQSPSLLFLDEPTSGLDTTSALDVVEKLADIASIGCTVLCTIHESTYRIQMMFNRIIILARGEMLYQGPPDEVGPYLEDFGLEVPANENNVEYFLDIIREFEQSEKGLDPLVQFQQEGTRFAGFVTGFATSSTPECGSFHAKTPLGEDWVGGFDHSLTSFRTRLAPGLKLPIRPNIEKSFLSNRSLRGSNPEGSTTHFIASANFNSISGTWSRFRRTSKTSIDALGQNISPTTTYSNTKGESGDEGEGNGKGQRYQNSWLREVTILAQRSFKIVIRTPELFLIREVIALVMSIILATLFLNPQKNLAGVNQLISYFVFVLTLIFFSCTDSLPTFIDERYVFIREMGTKTYRASSYTVASFLVYLPTSAVHAATYLVIAWWVLDLDGGINGFLTLFFILFVSLVTANSLVTLVGTLVPNCITGYTVVMALTALSVLTSGYFIKRKEIPIYWQWLHYMSTIKYSLEAAVRNEFAAGKCFSTVPVLPAPSALGQISQFSDPVEFPNGTSSGCYLFGENVVEALGMNQFTGWGGIGLLVLWCANYHFLLYIVLCFYSKSQQK